MDEVSTAGFAVVPYIRGVREPIKEQFWQGKTLKLPKNLFSYWGIFSFNPPYPVPREQRTDSDYSILCKRLRTRIYIFIKN